MADGYDRAKQDARQWQNDHNVTLDERAVDDLTLMLLVGNWCAGTFRIAPDAWRRQWADAEPRGGVLVPS